MSIVSVEIPKKLTGSLKGTITAPRSIYKPDKKEIDRIQEILKKFSLSHELMHKTYQEFNDKSLITMTDQCQKLWNSWREPKSSNPDESWKSNAVRPIVRNRTISIAAHITGSLVTPHIEAQNKDQLTDKDAATVMRNLLEWANEQADYTKTFVYTVIAALVNPGVIIHTEYGEVYRTIKEIDEKGQWKEKKTLDQLLSGFRDSIVPLDELFIANIYQHDIQKQPYLIWRRIIDYSEAMTKYGDNQNFQNYVRPGIHTLFDSATATFYDVYDHTLEERLVEEVIYYDRYQDLQVVIVNGVMITDPDQPNPRKDKRYPFAKGGYELIDEGRFFYYFSLVRKMKDDAEIINTLYRMIIDGTFLQLMPPLAIFGDEIQGSNVITPGTSISFSQDSKIQPIDINSNVGLASGILEKMERSVSESSSDILQSGQQAPGSQTAFEISRLEQNAMVMLGMFGKMVGFLVKDLGTLRMGDILQHMTVAEIDQIVGDQSVLKYRSFLVPNQLEQGKNTNHRIMFTGNEDLFNKPEETRGFDMLAAEGGAPLEQIPNLSPEDRQKFQQKAVNGDTRLFMVNPQAFRDLKYKVVVRPDVTTPPSDNLKKALNLELYDRAIANPLANQQALFRDLLLGSYENTRDNVDKYVTEQNPVQQAQMQQQAQQPAKSDVMQRLFGGGAEGKLNQTVGQSPING